MSKNSLFHTQFSILSLFHPFNQTEWSVWLGWKQGGWKIGRRKYDGKWNFPLFGSGEKTRETKNREENFPSVPTFFYPPNLGGKWGGKSAEWCALHKYPHFIHLIYLSLYSSHLWIIIFFFSIIPRGLHTARI